MIKEHNKIHYFSVKELEEIQNKLISESIEWNEVWSYWYIWWRDSSDLNSIIEFMKNDIYYEAFLDKIVYLFYSINKNHIFKDWNKRSSLYFSAYFLHLNWYDSDSVIDFIRTFEDVTVLIASNEITKEDLKSNLIYFFQKTDII